MRITKEPEIRKMEIVAAAKAIFEEQGVGKSSMAQIAQKAKVTKGLVYYYFASKDDLVEAVVEGLAMETDRSLKEILQDQTQDFLEKLSNILGLYFGIIQKNATLMALSNTNPGIFELVKTRLVESAIHHTKDLIVQGVDEGVLGIEYPEYTLKILIGGIADLYLEGVDDPKVLAILIEQILSIPRGSLQIL